MLGARLPQALRNVRLTDLMPLNASGDTPAQIAFALTEEMALTLEDVVMRRTGLGQFGKPSPQVLDKIAGQMAAHLGWNEIRKASEIASLDHIYGTAE
jgi:glycerol-3-phosphate dehydrogenase